LQAQIARWIGMDEPQSALLLSPPGYGKTTLLREWVRYFSDRGFTAAIADERSEIAALADGVPQLAVGRCTDVMEGCSKWQAAVMLLKTMSPALLALDEITAPEDAKAVSLCTHCGTAVIACAHAAGLDDLRQRPIYRELLALGAFHQAVIIEKQDGQRVYRMERWEETKC
ncbi:MAG: stage III sporulation protein AA, partial [Butyricicoccus sp.]